ncbi:hypothetical protein PSYJA_40595, partial [Pseudomonas syringae pv. japonica str. M301072]
FKPFALPFASAHFAPFGADDLGRRRRTDAVRIEVNGMGQSKLNGLDKLQSFRKDNSKAIRGVCR